MNKGSVKIDLSDILEGLIIHLSKKNYQTLLNRWNPANFKEKDGTRYKYKSEIPGCYRGGALWGNRSKCLCSHYYCGNCPLGKRLKLENMDKDGYIMGEKYLSCFGMEKTRKHTGCNYILQLIFEGDTSWYKSTEWDITVTDMAKVKQVYDILVNAWRVVGENKSEVTS